MGRGERRQATFLDACEIGLVDATWIRGKQKRYRESLLRDRGVLVQYVEGRTARERTSVTSGRAAESVTAGSERRARQTELARTAAFDQLAAERPFAFDLAARLVAAANPRLQQKRS